MAVSNDFNSNNTKLLNILLSDRNTHSSSIKKLPPVGSMDRSSISCSMSPREQKSQVVEENYQLHRQSIKFESPTRSRLSRVTIRKENQKKKVRRSSTNLERYSKYSSKSPTILHRTESLVSDSMEGFLEKKYSEKSIVSIHEAREDDSGILLGEKPKEALEFAS